MRLPAAGAPEKIIVRPCPPSQWVSASKEAASLVAAAHGGAGEELALHNALAAAGIAVKLPIELVWQRSSYANGVVAEKNLV